MSEMSDLLVELDKIRMQFEAIIETYPPDHPARLLWPQVDPGPAFGLTTLKNQRP
jgi:hypothetical protein